MHIICALYIFKNRLRRVLEEDSMVLILQNATVRAISDERSSQ